MNAIMSENGPNFMQCQGLLYKNKSELLNEYQKKINANIEELVGGISEHYEYELRNLAELKNREKVNIEKMNCILVMLNAVTHLTNVINFI